MEYFARVLIVDTNIELYDYTEGLWAEYGIKSKRVDDINQALEDVTVYVYHLIVIVECREQRQYALDSIQLFRERTLAPIVLASTEPVDSEYIIIGLDMGADEVWEIPKNIEEAIAKGNAIIRRYLNFFKEIDQKSTTIINGNIILSESKRLVYVKGNKVELTKTEFDILTLLTTHPGIVFTYDQIFNNAWGDEFAGNSKEALRTLVHKLRKKLKLDPTIPNYIKTHLRIGYSFTPEYDKQY